MSKIFSILLIFVFVSASSQTELIRSGERWKFRADGTDLDTSWRAVSYNDHEWPAGSSPLGYGHGDEGEVVPGGPEGNFYTTTYFRKSFVVKSPAVFKGYAMQVKRDDGVVVYLNGVEIYRANMPLGIIQYATLASSDISDNGKVWLNVSVDPELIRRGNNVITAEVHQCGPTSSDLRFDLKLTGIRSGSLPVNEVRYKWVGALQPTSAMVVAKMYSASLSCRVVVSENADLSSPIYSTTGHARGNLNYIARMKLSNLRPGTKYYYAISSNGAIDSSSDDIGTFTTPEDDAFSYRFVVASCAVTSDHQVYQAMLNKSPLFYISTGDLHYGNPNSGSDIFIHRNPYEQRILARKPAQEFFDRTPFAYVWDDHDFAGDGSNYSSEGRINARKAYQEYIPHYSLPAGEGDIPIYQAFTIGRVRFIMTDLRSERTASSIMSATQKTWFKQECLEAREKGQIIAWISPVSFGGTSSDTWGGYKDERTELSDFFRDNQIRNMFILSGDAHMIAIDNGSNHDFSSGNNNPNNYPVFQAAALNNKGSTKGGTYSEGGTFPNPDATTGQYGVVDVTDHGGADITIKFTAYRTDGNSTNEMVLTSYKFIRLLSLSPTALLSARAAEKGKGVQLSWEVPDSVNIFTIDRSSDGKNYTKVDATSKHRGTLLDENATTGWNYYVLRSPGHSPIFQKIFIRGKVELSIAPNPASTRVSVHLDDIKDVSSGRYLLYNMKMKTELQGEFRLTEGENIFDIDTSSLASGEYILHVVLSGCELKEKLMIIR